MKLVDKIKNDTLIFPLQSEEKSTTIHELLNHLLSEGYLTLTTKLEDLVCLVKFFNKISLALKS